MTFPINSPECTQPIAYLFMHLLQLWIKNMVLYYNFRDITDDSLNFKEIYASSIKITLKCIVQFWNLLKFHGYDALFKLPGKTGNSVLNTA